MTEPSSKSVRRVVSQYTLSSKPAINFSNNSKQNNCQPFGKKIDNQALIKKSGQELSRPNITTKALKFKKRELQRSPIPIGKSKSKNKHTRSKNCLSKTPDYSQRSNSRSSYKKTQKKCAGKSMQILCRVATNIKQVSRSKSKSKQRSKSKDKKRSYSNSRSISQTNKSPCLKAKKIENSKKPATFTKKSRQISSSFSINLNNKSTQRQSPTLQAHKQDIELKKYLVNKKKKIKSESLRLQQQQKIKVKKKQQELVKVEKARKSNLKASTYSKKKKPSKKDKPIIHPFQQSSISEERTQYKKAVIQQQIQYPISSKKISIKDELHLQHNAWQNVVCGPAKHNRYQPIIERYFKNRATSRDYFWLVNAAITIQRFWRGYQTRKNLAAKAKQLENKILIMQKRINNKSKKWMDSSYSNYEQNQIDQVSEVHEVHEAQLPRKFFPKLQQAQIKKQQKIDQQISSSKSSNVEEQLKKLKQQLQQRKINEIKLQQQNKILKQRTCQQNYKVQSQSEQQQESQQQFQSPRINLKNQEINFSSPIPMNGIGIDTQPKIQSPLSASFLKQSENKKQNIIFIQNHSSGKSSERKPEQDEQQTQKPLTKHISASIKERLQINISEMDSLNETGLINYLKAKSPKPAINQQSNRKFSPWNEYSEQKFQELLTHKISTIQQKFNKKAEMFQQLLQSKILSPKTYQIKLNILNENFSNQRKQIQQKKFKYRQALEILKSLSEQCSDQAQNYFKKLTNSPKNTASKEPYPKQLNPKEFKINMNDSSTDMENIQKQVQQLDKRSLTIFEQVQQESPIEENKQQLSTKKQIQDFTDIYFIKNFLIEMANYIRDNSYSRQLVIKNLQKPIYWNRLNFLKAFRTQQKTLQNHSHFDGYKVDLLYPYFYLYYDKDITIPQDVFNDFTTQFKENNKNHQVFRSFFFEAIYDGFNEALQYQRPGGPQGEQLPWHHYTTIRPKRTHQPINNMNLQQQETFIDQKFGKAIDRMLQWYITLCGFIAENMVAQQDQTISYNQQRDQIRQKRGALDLQRCIVEEQNKFIDYKLAQTQSKLILTEKIFYDIILETVFDIKSLA